MGWRFRKRNKLFPGVWLNWGLKGPSLTVAGTNISKRGVRSSFSIPGTGLSYQTKTVPWKKKARPKRAQKNNAQVVAGAHKAWHELIKLQGGSETAAWQVMQNALLACKGQKLEPLSEWQQTCVGLVVQQAKQAYPSRPEALMEAVLKIGPENSSDMARLLAADYDTDQIPAPSEAQLFQAEPPEEHARRWAFVTVWSGVIILLVIAGFCVVKNSQSPVIVQTPPKLSDEQIRAHNDQVLAAMKAPSPEPTVRRAQPVHRSGAE